jgi:hypothetical protein
LYIKKVPKFGKKFWQLKKKISLKRNKNSRKNT